nr:MAG TPA: hypothetical protein [Caudoviricetes sp.]
MSASWPRSKAPSTVITKRGGNPPQTRSETLSAFVVR